MIDLQRQARCFVLPHRKRAGRCGRRQGGVGAGFRSRKTAGCATACYHRAV